MPLLNILRVSNVVDIGSSFLVEIAEIFLPVLLIADQVTELAIGARYVVVVVSMVKIIFFA